MNEPDETIDGEDYGTIDSEPLEMIDPDEFDTIDPDDTIVPCKPPESIESTQSTKPSDRIETGEEDASE